MSKIPGLSLGNCSVSGFLRQRMRMQRFEILLDYNNGNGVFCVVRAEML
jgi:hypothetical protein